MFGCLYNKALNRSRDGFMVGKSPDGRRLPLYPTPISLIYISWSARLTRALSNLGHPVESESVQISADQFKPASLAC
ncbi:hypothetical protein MFFC18_18430 [Mariniblastus fucicola]|uniref:Uncharacterized protein n=1 Tax=Mariniblastus fucicola TaxID=980251 RepID=A0A5B9PAJ6_9BACT|nr:hypothetical protein MFFC18_18430 [Mariniblastus fucicola]